MTYHLIVEIDAQNMNAATAQAWEIFKFTLGLPFTIKAVPRPEDKAEEKAKVREAKAKALETELIEDGIVPANRRYYAEFVEKVRASAER